MFRIAVALAVLLAIAGAQDERWVYRHNGPADGNDAAGAITVGPDGSIYAAGYDRGIGTEEDAVVISLAPDGTERWSFFGRGDGNDRYSAVDMDVDGNVYAAGRTYSNLVDYRFIVSGFAPDTGAVRWHYVYQSPGSGPSIAYALAIAPAGNLYAAGHSTGITTGWDFTVISLSPAGSERWVYRYNGPGNGNDVANAVTVGPDGNIYAAGTSVGPGPSGQDFTVISLNPSATERWIYRYKGPGNDLDWAFAVAAAPDGNIYAAGYSSGTTTGADFTVISLTATGTERWVYRYDGPGSGPDMANTVAVGPDGNIYAAGLSAGSGTMWDFTVISLAPDGTERWVYRYNGPGNGNDGAHAIAVSPDGNVHIAGYSSGVGTEEDFTLISLEPDGTERWIYRHNGPGDGADIARAVAVGPDGSIHVAGQTEGVGTGTDFAVISLTPGAGVMEPTVPVPGPGLALRARGIRGRVLDYTLHLPEPATVRLSLWDRQGRRLDNWQVAAPAGASHQGRELAPLAAGVYFLTAETPGHRAGAKVIRTGN